MPKGIYKRIRKVSKETRQKLREKMSGKNNPMYGVVSPFKGKHHSVETKKLFSELGKKRVGSLCPGWRGGVRKTNFGYILIYSPNHPNKNKQKCVLEHRLVMEIFLGRFLNKWEIIHHKNGIKDDNRLDNLEIIISKGGIHSGEINCPYCQRKIKVL